MKATAVAHANIALVKYWGKRDVRLNLPAVGSISMTLAALETQTTVQFDKNLPADELILNGKRAPRRQEERAAAFVDGLRKSAGRTERARIVSENNFPTGAGLASSASGFAALTVAAARALGLEYSPAELSGIARQGSGSAARSIFGGFVEMLKGKAADGSDAVAQPLYPPDYWPLEMLILITESGEKDIGSTEGMTRTAETSPYYSAWIEQSAVDIAAMKAALAGRDFEQTGEIMEFSCLQMHGLALSANPGILYWNATTVTLIHEIRRLRKQGVPVYLTIDAGPQMKVLCPPGKAGSLRRYFEDVPGVQQILETGVGPDAYVVGE